MNAGTRRWRRQRYLAKAQPADDLTNTDDNRQPRACHVAGESRSDDQHP